MSRPKRDTAHTISHSVKERLETNEPLIVVYNLNSKHDMQTAVEALLLNNELSNTSSIFVIVPASDDEDDGNVSGSFDSTIGIQLSENYTRCQNNHKTESDLQLRRDTKCQVQPSERGSTMFELVFKAVNQFNFPQRKDITNKLCQMTTPYEVTNKLCQMTTPCEVTNKLCQVTAPSGGIKRPRRMKIPCGSRQRNSQDTRFCQNKQFINKPCQVQIPNEVIYEKRFIVGTDTTTDRPCCCKLAQNEDVDLRKSCCCVHTYFAESVQNCTKRIVTTESHLISPVLIKTDFSTDSMNRSSYLQPSNIAISSIPASLISPESEGFDTDAIFGIDRSCVYNTPIPEFEENKQLTIQSCQCTPEKLRRLLEQVLAEKSLNKMNVCCSPMEMSNASKRTRFLDINCSACLRTKHKTESNTCGRNPSFDCECDKLSNINGHPLQKLTASTLFCLDDKVNTGVQGTDLSTHTILTRQPKHLHSFGQQRRFNAKEGHSVVKARGTYTEAGKHSAVGATDADYKYVGKDITKRKTLLDHLPLNKLDQNWNTSSKNIDHSTSNIIRTMSGFKYPLNQPFHKPKLNVSRNILGRQMNSSRPHCDNISMCSKTNNHVKANLVRTLSGFKFPQKQPSHLQKPKQKVTLEDFLKYCANMNTTLACALPPSNNKRATKDFCKMQTKITIPSPPPLHESLDKSKYQKVKEDPIRGLKLSMSGKTSDSKGQSNVLSQNLMGQLQDIPVIHTVKQ